MKYIKGYVKYLTLMFLWFLLSLTLFYHLYLESFCDSCQSFKQIICFLVAGREAPSIPVNDSCVYEVLGHVAYSFEMVWDANEFLHLTEVFRLDFFQRWTKLELLLSAEMECNYNGMFHIL